MTNEAGSGTALFLDLDGTVLDIAATPDRAAAEPGLVDRLEALSARLDGALAILTGRTVAEVDRLLAPLVPVVAGVHGAELRLDPAEPVEREAEPMDERVVTAVQRLVEREEGTSIELKRVSVAVHYRLAPWAQPRIEAALHDILATGPGHLILCRGRKVLEILPRHVSKGAALEALMRRPAFFGKAPLMIGDDASDLAAFEAAERLGGCGLKVAGEHFARHEAAFESPRAVRAWLGDLLRGLP